jgi:hypothetical protein
MSTLPQWPTFKEIKDSVYELVTGYPSLNLSQRLITWFFLATFIAVFMLVVLPRLDCATNIPQACAWIARSHYQ